MCKEMKDPSEQLIYLRNKIKESEAYMAVTPANIDALDRIRFNRKALEPYLTFSAFKPFLQNYNKYEYRCNSIVC
jgi:hypothetical protein